MKSSSVAKFLVFTLAAAYAVLLFCYHMNYSSGGEPCVYEVEFSGEDSVFVHNGETGERYTSGNTYLR